MFGGKAAPSGASMMMKALGFDPQEFAANMEAVKTGAQQTVAHFDRRLEAIETRQTNIEVLLTQVLDRLPKTPVAAIEASNGTD